MTPNQEDFSIKFCFGQPYLGDNIYHFAKSALKFYNLIMKKERGSAIIIAVLLITAIGTIAFSFGRVFLLQAAKAALYENGISAYYAAESGLEEAFLRYRFDRESQVPFGGDIAANVFRSNMTLTNEEVITSGINGGIYEGIAKSKNLPTNWDINNQIYDLKMDSKSTQFGSLDATAPHTIGRDNSEKIDTSLVFAEVGGDLDLTFRPTNVLNNTVNGVNNFQGDSRCALVEIKIIGKTNASSSPVEFKGLFMNAASNSTVCPVAFGLRTAFTTFPNSADGTYSITGLRSRLGYTGVLEQSSLFIKPLGADIQIVLTGADNNNLFGASTLVTSTGYYGGVARTLEANIDRQSGTLYDLFDYVIYKAKP